MRTRREAHTEATQRALLRAGRRLFAARGFAGTGIEAIARAARVTTGALYHHFASKESLFQAVAEEIEAEILQQAASVAESDPWRRLRAAFERLLDACAEPDVQRIVFREAPLVIGAERWHAIELRYAHGALRATLENLVRAHVLRDYPIDLLAPVLLSLLSESASSIARADDRASARAQASDLVGRFLESLRV